LEKLKIVAIASVKVSREDDAGIEILDYIFPYDSKAKYVKTSFPGIILILSKLNSDRVMEMLKDRIISKAYRIVPIQRLIKIDLNGIINTVIELASKIKGEVKFKVECKLRGVKSIERNIIVKEIAEKLKEKWGWIVDLENPEYIVTIEGIGENVGISVVRRENIWNRSRFIKRFHEYFQL